MATCPMCDQEMTDHVSCKVTEYHRDGVPFPRIPFTPDPDVDRCHDCGTPAGGQHHPGCDDERCPNPECPARMPAGWDQGRLPQAISCGCWWDEDGPDHHPAFVVTAGQLAEQLAKCDPASKVVLYRGDGDIPIRRVDAEHGGTVYLDGKPEE